MDWQVVLQGNFDKASLGVDDLPGLSAARHARKTILRFREQLQAHPKRDAIRQFMTQLPEQCRCDGAQFVHGTVRDPLNEYLFPEAIYDQSRMHSIGRLIDALCFCGHTHIPGIFTCSQQTDWSYLTQNEIHGDYLIHGLKTICNVGSVGQPRDEDTRACYVLWKKDSVEFRRIPYDIDRTIAKIKAISDDDIDGDRYRFGR